MSMLSRVKKISYVGILIAFSVTLSYIEFILPITSIVKLPGFKLGLANIVVLYTIKRSKSIALYVDITRVIISSLLFSGVSSLIYSLTAAMVSYSVMLLTVRFIKMNCTNIGYAVIAAVAHNLTQLLVYSIIMNTFSIMSYSSVLVIAAVISGTICGLFLNLVESRLTRFEKK